MINAKILSKISRELNNLSEGRIFLIETTALKILEVHLAAVKWLSEKNYTQIILSTSRPCKNLLNLCAENGIDVSKSIIICTCCQEKKNNKQENKKVIHLQSSSSLTEMALALSKCMERIKGKKFIFIDSINTMLIHYKPNTLARFIHSILTKMRINNVSGLLISLEAETDKAVKAEIAQLCDKIIKV